MNNDTKKDTHVVICIMLGAVTQRGYSVLEQTKIGDF